jgi:hypothetical protein
VKGLSHGQAERQPTARDEGKSTSTVTQGDFPEVDVPEIRVTQAGSTAGTVTPPG